MSTVLRAIVALCVAAPASAAAEYPDRPITLIVPFTLGTGIDIIARALGQKFLERWGQAVVVDNKPGASGNIGNEAVAKARPDGYTLLMSATSMVTNAVINRKVPYDPEKSYAPVALIASGTVSLLVSNTTPAQSVREFVEYAKKRPGQLNYGTPGNGTTHHLAMELFKRDTGIDITHIPYKGTAGVTTDLVAGRLDAAFMPIHTALPYVQQRSIRMLAVIAQERISTVPSVPTMKEAGYPNIHVENWYGMHAPAGTPDEILSRLNAEINVQLGVPSFRDILVNQGLNPIGGPPARLAGLVRSERARWPAIISAAGIKAD